MLAYMKSASGKTAHYCVPAVETRKNTWTYLFVDECLKGNDQLPSPCTTWKAGIERRILTSVKILDVTITNSLSVVHTTISSCYHSFTKERIAALCRYTFLGFTWPWNGRHRAANCFPLYRHRQLSCNYASSAW